MLEYLKRKCDNPKCPCQETDWPFLAEPVWVYQTAPKPDTGPVADFRAYASIVDVSDDMEPEDCACCDQPMSNTERVTDLEEDVQNLRAAVLDLTQVIEYLLIWTGKKGNKMDRDKYLDGYIDPIRVIL